jgi:hypothetical protein
MASSKYIGMDVHKESISIAVMNSLGMCQQRSVCTTSPCGMARQDQ